MTIFFLQKDLTALSEPAGFPMDERVAASSAPWMSNNDLAHLSGYGYRELEMAVTAACRRVEDDGESGHGASDAGAGPVRIQQEAPLVPT